MPISDQDLEGILEQAATLRYKGLDPNASIALIRESVAAYNQRKPTSTGVGQTPEVAEISLDSAYQTLCRLIESDRGVVRFGVFSNGNITGDGFANEAKGYRYDVRERRMVYVGWNSIVGIPSTDPNNELPRWKKRSVHLRGQNERIIGVDQAIQGEEHSRVLNDARGGIYYRVGIVFTENVEAYDKAGLDAMSFVLNSLKEKPQQLIGLMDKLADRYVPFYNQGIKALEASSRQR